MCNLSPDSEERTCGWCDCKLSEEAGDFCSVKCEQEFMQAEWENWYMEHHGSDDPEFQ